MTKRMILSQDAWIYDPIGFAAAFIIRAKIGVQLLWQLGQDSLFQEMKELDNVSFGRSLSADNVVDPPMLCVFADASQDAFGACTYVIERMTTPLQ